MVEGEDPALAGDGQEVTDGGGNGREGRGIGIDQGTEDPRGEGLSRGRGALEDEKGEGAVGAESGEKPSEAADPGSAIGQIEAGAEGGQWRAGVGGDRRGERHGGAGGLEEGILAGRDAPAFGGDGDELTFGIGEVEEDLAGDGIGAAGADAPPDGEALVFTGGVGLGFEVIEERLEGGRGGDGIALREELREEPVAKGRRADGEDEKAAGGGFVETDEGLAVTGGERDATAGDAEEIRQRRRRMHEMTKKEYRSQESEFGLQHPISG